MSDFGIPTAHAISIGSLNYDIFLETDTVPIEGISLTAHGAYFDAGGKAENQAIQLARLGMETHLVGHVGKDAVGEYLVGRAREAGVLTEHVTCVDAPSGVGVTFKLPGGLVAGAANPGANGRVTVADVEAAADLFQPESFVVLQMEVPLEVNECAIRLARERGCTVVMNTAPALPYPDELLALCDVLVFNEHEAAFYAGCTIDTPQVAREQAAALAARYGSDCVITLGEQGCVASFAGQLLEQPALRVPVASALGAGDSFVGGLTYALAGGAAPAEALAFATRCSTVTIQSMGASEGMPTLEQVTQ